MKRLSLITIAALFFLLGCSLTLTVPQQQEPTAAPLDATTSVPSPTDLPLSPLPTLTPSRTLMPPPTFEPPTNTPPPTTPPTATPTVTVDVSFSIPGLRGAETATPTSTPGCTVQQGWTLVHEVGFQEALANIAAQYGTTVDALAAGNCLDDPNLIRVGQRLRVPGDNLPPAPPFACDTPWELLTPLDGTQALGWDGTLTFNWRGPRAAVNLIRITRPEGGVYERVIERRQNETIDLEELPAGGTYTWQVFPLDSNYSQPPTCPESPTWRFTKQQRPPDTPTPTPPGGIS